MSNVKFVDEKSVLGKSFCEMKIETRICRRIYRIRKGEGDAYLSFFLPCVQAARERSTPSQIGPAECCWQDRTTPTPVRIYILVMKTGSLWKEGTLCGFAISVGLEE
jgi:hypothetical protein